MRISLATAAGLADLGDDGHLDWRLKGDSRAVTGEWAIVDDAVVGLDDSHHAMIVDPAPQCLVETSAGVLVGTAQARLFALDRGATVVTPVGSFDRIPTRDQWYTPWGGPPDTRSIAVDASGTTFVNVHVGGVWRSDGDGSWTEVVDRDTDTHQILAADGAIVVAAAVGVRQRNHG